MTKKKKKQYTHSKSYKAIQKHGLPKIKKLWTEYGSYKTGRLLDTSPFAIRYIVHQNGWQRPASKCPHLMKAVQNGNMPASHYRSLDFSNVQLNPKSSGGENNA